MATQPIVSDSILEQVVVALGKGRQVKGGGINKDDVRSHVTPIYDRIWESCLRQHYWVFAEDTAILERITDKTPLFGFTAYYRLPADFVSVSYVNGNNVYLEGWNSGWHEYGTLMAANFQPYLSYTKRVTDTTLFPSHFMDFLVHKLAAAICISVTGDKELYTLLQRHAAMVQMDSINIDFRDIGDYTVVEQGSIAAARRVGSNSIDERVDVSGVIQNSVTLADGSQVTITGVSPLKDMNGNDLS